MQTMIFRTGQLTPEDAEDLNTYIASLPALLLLTPESEAQLCEYVQRGRDAERVPVDDRTLQHGQQIAAGLDAQNELVERNIRLSIIAACKYAGRGVPVVDLVQEGNIGLMRAVKTFDASKSRFSTYALQAIVHAVRRAVANHGNTIRLPVWAQDGSKRPDISEAARELVKTRSVVSIDGEHGRGGRLRTGGASVQGGALIVPDPGADTEAEALAGVLADERRALVAGLLDVLPPRQRAAIDMRLFKGMTWREIGRELGCSYEAARMLYVVAVRRLREVTPKEAINVL